MDGTSLLLIITVVLGLAIGAGAVASSKGRNGYWYFLAGLFLPLIALLVAIGVSDNRVQQKDPTLTERCPYCGERIRPSVMKCPHCGSSQVSERGLAMVGALEGLAAPAPLVSKDEAAVRRLEALGVDRAEVRLLTTTSEGRLAFTDSRCYEIPDPPDEEVDSFDLRDVQQAFVEEDGTTGRTLYVDTDAEQWHFSGLDADVAKTLERWL